MERVKAILLIGGIAFFGLAFALMAILPIMTLSDLPMQQLPHLAPEVSYAFTDLHERYPEAFEKAFEGGPTLGNYYAALRRGREVYVGEGCWHCHSQYVRPVSNEALRFGPVSVAAEYQNVMQKPVLFGTRRVGPDLTREGGKRSNDWHVAHFWKPRATSPVSVMPRYPWLYDVPGGDGLPVLNRDGFSLVAYVQWLGTWARPEPEMEATGETP
jgi:hypothetical protein